MKELLEALKDYIDKHWEYEHYWRQSGDTCVEERKAMEAAWIKVEEACNKIERLKGLF